MMPRFLLFFVLIVTIIVHQSDTGLSADEIANAQVIFVEHENRLTLSCPLAVIDWKLTTYNWYWLLRIVSKTESAPHPYDCVGTFSYSGCLQEIELDHDKGSLVTITSMLSEYAGIYVCTYKKTEQLGEQAKLWDVNMIQSTPELEFKIDGSSQLAETTTRTPVANGTLISISCTILSDGFTKPAAVLVRRDSKGVEQVLQTVAQSSYTSVIRGQKTTVSVKYTVKESDAAFDVVCKLVDSSLVSTSTATFQGPVIESESLSTGAIVGIVIGVIALVSLLIAALVFIQYRRRRMHNHCSYPNPPSHHAQLQPPPIHYSQSVKVPTVPPPPYPPYIGISAPTPIPGFAPSAAPSQTFPTGNTYPVWNVSDYPEQPQPTVSNPDVHHVPMNQQVHLNGEPLHEEMAVPSNQPYYLTLSADESALEHADQPSQLQ